MDVYLDILSIVAESLTEDGKTANMFRIIIYRHTEAETAAIVQMEAVDGYIGNLQTVNESSLFVDD